MEFATTRFGTLAVPEHEIIDFPAGLPGFEDAKRFITVESDETDPFVWLQSLSRPDLAFLTIPPQLIVRDYRPEVPPEAREALRLNDDSVVEVLAIVTVPEDPREMTANLRAPIIINRSARVGRQEVELSGRHPLRQRICQANPSGDKKAVAGR
ncbi:MAG: flagellar assembly protein FliW [Chloroflexota bacterium]